MKIKLLSIVSAILVVLCLFLLGTQINALIKSNYEKDLKYFNHWSLAEKSSTIAAKQEHIENFVKSLETGHKNGEFSSHNAIWLKTPDNSFEYNLAALKTLSHRLGEIKNMDPNSFQYNTAIQQITQQEQGEAQGMNEVFSGCYNLKNWIVIWDWVGFLLLLPGIFAVVALAVGGLYIIVEWGT